MAFGGQAPDRFDLVKQFDAMRSNQSSSGLGGTQAYQPSPSAAGNADIPNGDPNSMKGVSYSGTGAGSTGKALAGKLGQYKGFQFDEAFMPFVDQIARAYGGLRISSGYRDPQHNAEVNGVKNSYHLKGGAVDFSGSAKDMQSAAGLAKSLGLRVLIHNAGSGQHLHVSF